MGVRALPRLAERLSRTARPADEPAAVVERGTLPGQRTVLATLGDVAERARRRRAIRAPAVTVVGAGRGPARAARLARGAAAVRPHRRGDARARAGQRAGGAPAGRWARRWSRRRRSARAARRAAAAARRLRPRVRDEPGRRAELWARLRAAGLDARALAGRARRGDRARHRAGAARARDRRRRRARARAVAEGLVEALADVAVARALVVRAREGRDVLPDALRERGAEVDVVALYETVAEPLDEATAAAARGGRLRTFTSASTVRFFVAAAGADALRGPRLVSIGPATSEALREHGAEPHVEADPHTPTGSSRARRRRDSADSTAAALARATRSRR